jgi:hypothetical protein
MAKRITKSTKVDKPKVSMYQFEAQVNDVVFKTKAKDMRTALGEFVSSEDYPFGAKTPLFLKYSKGKNERTRRYFPLQARRLLRSMQLKDSVIELMSEKMTLELA